MENLEQIFRTEALELIGELENSLVQLEKSTNDKKQIEKVFRIMHTLKGNCNMFGYESMGEFTHVLETIFDLARNEQIMLSKEILDISLLSIDHLTSLVTDGKLNLEKNIVRHKELKKRIKEITNSSEQTPQNTSIPSEIVTYYILFRPGADIFKESSINLIFVLQDLAALGQVKITPHVNNIPSLEELDVSTCYIYWDIYLATTSPIEKIREAFIFIPESSEVNIHEVAKGNLLENNVFVNKLEDQQKTSEDVSIHELKDIAKNLLEFVKEQSNSVSDNKEQSHTSIRVSSEKLDELMNLVSELVTTQASLTLLAENSNNPELTEVAENMEKISRQLRDNAFSICLVPIEVMLTRFQRLVRDLSAELNKSISFVTEGAETELDKSIIEALIDPLLHILRNCIDHGIEDAETRIKSGKDPQGKILLKSYYSGASVMIEISDDGKGVDSNKIRNEGVRKGLIDANANLTEREILELLFEAGFSTAEKVTEVSGRGVGMDVVKRKITDVRGEVWVESEFHKGTTIFIKLPLTLSIIDGLLVRVHETFFVIPLVAVHKCYEMPYKTIDNKYNNYIILDEKPTPFIDLRKEFDIHHDRPLTMQVVLVKYEESEVCLCVDEIEGEYQAVLKSLGRVYKYIDIVSGATILGNGTIALVLDTNKIIKNYAELKMEEIS